MGKTVVWDMTSGIPQGSVLRSNTSLYCHLYRSILSVLRTKMSLGTLYVVGYYEAEQLVKNVCTTSWLSKEIRKKIAKDGS